MRKTKENRFIYKLKLIYVYIEIKKLEKLYAQVENKSLKKLYENFCTNFN